MLLRLTRGLACRFTFIEQQNLKVVEMFFQVDTDGNGELDVWEFEDALVRGVLRSLPARAPADWPLGPAQLSRRGWHSRAVLLGVRRCTVADGYHHDQRGHAAGVR